MRVEPHTQDDPGNDVRLTVVLPNYNHAKFIPHALEGLLAQTRPADEVILIDDASTDNSIEVIQTYVDRSPSVRLVRNSKNAGVVANMNRGLREATGSLIYFAAADDVTYPGFFAKGAALLARYAQAGLFSCRSDILDPDGRSLGPLSIPMPILQDGYIPPEAVADLFVRDDSWIMGNATIYRRDALLAISGFTEDLGSFTDGYASRVVALTHGACYSPDILCAWRRMLGGFAWSQAIDRAATLNTISRVEQKIAETDGVFPPDYVRRWKGRHLFATERFALVQRRRAARDLGVIPYMKASLYEIVLTIWLLVKLRPRDIVTVFRRHVRNFLGHT
jgi:glycosyltransferase involved in cell wall biosynthesis